MIDTTIYEVAIRNMTVGQLSMTLIDPPTQGDLVQVLVEEACRHHMKAEEIIDDDEDGYDDVYAQTAKDSANQCLILLEVVRAAKPNAFDDLPGHDARRVIGVCVAGIEIGSITIAPKPAKKRAATS